MGVVVVPNIYIVHPSGSAWTEFFNGDADGSQVENIDSLGTLDHSTTGGGIEYNDQWENMHFTYIPVTGDFTITAHIVQIVPGSFDTDDAGAGLLCRSKIDATVKPVQIGVYRLYDAATNLWGNLECHRHETDGSAPLRDATSTTTYTWMRIERSGTTFNVYRSTDGTFGSAWKTYVMSNMPSTTYVGLFTNAQDDPVAMPVEFDNITLT